MTIGERIKNARKAKDMTQEELGKLCGTTKQTIQRYESGVTTNIPLDRVQAIADALGVTPAYLMEWEDYAKINEITKLLKNASPEKLSEIEQFIRFALRES